MSEGEAAAERFLEPAPALRRGLVVPDPADFEALVASHGTSEGLRDLRQAVAAWQAVAEKCDHAFEEVLKLTTYRLQVERALGARLAQDVRPGRVKKRSPEVTFDEGGRLPDGVTKQQAAKYRQLAAVPDDAFAAYLQVSKERRKLPTSAGARRFGVGPPRSGRRKPVRHPRPSLLQAVDPAIVDFVDRLMTPDVVIGPPVIRGAAIFAEADSVALKSVKGDVLALTCPDPRFLLPRFATMQRAGVVSQVLALVSADFWSDWFRQALLNGWAFCMVVPPGDGVGFLVAHLGGRRAAFFAAADVACLAVVRHS